MGLWERGLGGLRGKPDMASLTRRLWMPVIGGRARPLAGAGVPLGDWGLAGVPPSVALPDSADDWDSEEGTAGAVVAVVLAILFSLRFSFLSFFFFLRSFFSFFFSASKQSGGVSAVGAAPTSFRGGSPPQQRPRDSTRESSAPLAYAHPPPLQSGTRRRSPSGPLTLLEAPGVLGVVGLLGARPAPLLFHPGGLLSPANLGSAAVPVQPGHQSVQVVRVLRRPVVLHVVDP